MPASADTATREKRRDLHAEITAQLIAAIEANPGEPSLPWQRASGRPLFKPVNARTAKPYNGINVITLWVVAEARGFSQPTWATYKQWIELGAQVRKGEKASLVVFYKEFDTEPDTDNPDDDGKRRVARASYAFNADQVDGYAAPDAPEPLGPIERIAAADKFVSATGARIQHGGERAYYRPSTDQIQMPDENLFCGTRTITRTEGYYSTLLHELTHWTGAANRLERQFSKRFGDHAYAAEELVATIGEAILCAELQIIPEPRPDHAQYLAQWLTLLRADNRAIFTAAAKASQAVSYLNGLQSAETAIAA